MPSALAFTNRRIDMQNKYFAIFKTSAPSTPPKWNMRGTGFYFRMCGCYIRIGRVF